MDGGGDAPLTGDERLAEEAVDGHHGRMAQRQRDILESITRGLTNKEIALQFDISLESVKSHIKIILEKLNASSRTEAASIAQRKHLLKV